jgi:hypothetical protein
MALIPASFSTSAVFLDLLALSACFVVDGAHFHLEFKLGFGPVGALPTQTVKLSAQGSDSHSLHYIYYSRLSLLQDKADEGLSL